MSDQNDTPDIPPEVLARQPRALTPATAELMGRKDYMDEGGQMTGPTTAQKAASAAARAARTKAEEFHGIAPLKGMTPEQIQVVKDRYYPDAPKMSVLTGDRTPAFVNWLWANYPFDAAIRYAYRNIWPTVLPAKWAPERVSVQAGPLTVSVQAPRLYTQEEVDALRAKDARANSPTRSAPRAPRARQPKSPAQVAT